MNRAIRGALRKRMGRSATAASSAVPSATSSPTEELLAAEPMETKRAQFIKAAREATAVYHSLNGYDDAQGAFFAVMKREGFDVLAWLIDQESQR